MASNDKSLDKGANTSGQDQDKTSPSSSTSSVLDTLREAESSASDLDSLNAINQRYNPNLRQNQPVELKTPTQQEIEQAKTINSTNPTPIKSTGVPIKPDTTLPETTPQSSTTGLDQLNQKLDDLSSTTRPTLAEFEQGLSQIPADTTFIPTQPLQSSTTAANTSPNAADTSSTTGALDALNKELSGIAPGADPLQQRNQKEAVQPQDQSLTQTIQDVLGENEQDKESQDERFTGIKNKFKPEPRTGSFRPNSVRTYANVRRGAKSLLSNVKDAITDNGQDVESGGGSENKFSFSVPRSGSAGRGGYVPDEAPSSDSDTESNNLDTPTESGDANEAPTSGSSRGGGLFNRFRGLGGKLGKAKGLFSKAKYLPFLKFLLIALVLFLILIIILVILDSTNKTLTQANSKSSKIFFEYFAINEKNNLKVEKDGLLKITELNNITFEYELKDSVEYKKYFTTPNADSISIKGLKLTALTCIPLDYEHDDDETLSTKFYVPELKTIDPKENPNAKCFTIMWNSFECNFTTCGSDPEKLTVDFEFDKAVPQQAFGDGTRIFQVYLMGELHISVGDQTIVQPIDPIVKCFDMSLGAGATNYSVSCNSPTNVVGNVGQPDSPGVVSGDTPEGCPFFAPGGLNCTNRFRTQPEVIDGATYPTHPAVDYQPVGKHPEYAVKSPIKGIAYILYDSDKANACGQSVEIQSPDGKNKYSLHHLNPNSPALLGKGTSFEIEANGDLGNYFSPGEGPRVFPGTTSLCWSGPHIHFVHLVNDVPIDSFDEIEKACNTKLGKVLGCVTR